MAKFTWQDGTLVSKAKVEVGGTIYEVDPEEYSGATPLSASNLNAMQDGIYDDIDEVDDKRAGTVLYSNASGTTGEITLLENISNYRFLEVYGFENTTNSQLYTKYDVSSGKNINLNSLNVIENGNLMRFISTDYSVSSNTITPISGNSGIVHIFNRVINAQQQENAVLVTKIIGYK